MDINLTAGDEEPGTPQSRKAALERINQSALRLVRDQGVGPRAHLSIAEARMIADLLDELGAALPASATDPRSRRAHILSTLIWDRWRF